MTIYLSNAEVRPVGLEFEEFLDVVASPEPRLRDTPEDHGHSDAERADPVVTDVARTDD